MNSATTSSSLIWMSSSTFSSSTVGLVTFHLHTQTPLAIQLCKSTNSNTECRYMESEDFERVIVDTGLFNDLFSKPDIANCFNKAMNT